MGFNVKSKTKGLYPFNFASMQYFGFLFLQRLKIYLSHFKRKKILEILNNTNKFKFILIYEKMTLPI